MLWDYELGGALVSGTLNLDYLDLPCRLEFIRCRFENALSFEKAKIPELVLDNVALPSLSLTWARVAGDCSLVGLRSGGGVDASQVHVRGLFNVSNAKLSSDTNGKALRLDGADIGGNAFLPGLDTEGEVRMSGARIGSQLNLRKAKLTNAYGPALVLDSAEIALNAILEELETEGEVRALGCRIKGQLVLEEAKLNNPEGEALCLDGANVSGEVFLTKMEAAGGVRAIGIEVGGQLGAKEAQFSNPGGFALNLSESTIASAFLEKIQTAGTVRATHARIKDQLNLVGAKLTSPDEQALVLNNADIAGNAFLTELEVDGAVLIDAAQIKGQLNLARAKLRNPDGTALSLERLSVTGDVVFEKLETTGEVRATETDLKGLNLRGAWFSCQSGNALDLQGSRLGTVVVDETIAADGKIRLAHASIRILHVGNKKPARGLPPLSEAHGWKVDTVHGFLLSDRTSARDWLDTIDARPRAKGRREFAAQPWKELAKVYDQIGQPEDGRRLRFWAAQRTTRVAPLASKLVRWPYAALVGYGYYPAIILGWLTSLWITVFLLCSLNAQAFTPTDLRASTVTVEHNGKNETIRTTGATVAPSNYPNFSPTLFAMDTAIPPVATGQTLTWRVTENSWLPGTLGAIKAFAWALTALLLAGITGLLRKD